MYIDIASSAQGNQTGKGFDVKTNMNKEWITRNYVIITEEKCYRSGLI